MLGSILMFVGALFSKQSAITMLGDAHCVRRAHGAAAALGTMEHTPWVTSIRAR
jgi:hypothetical protein